MSLDDIDSDMVQIPLKVRRAIRTKLKHLAADEDRSVQDILNELIEREFK